MGSKGKNAKEGNRSRSTQMCFKTSADRECEELARTALSWLNGLLTRTSVTLVVFNRLGKAEGERLSPALSSIHFPSGALKKRCRTQSHSNLEVSKAIDQLTRSWLLISGLGPMGAGSWPKKIFQGVKQISSQCDVLWLWTMGYKLKIFCVFTLQWTERRSLISPRKAWALRYDIDNSGFDMNETHCDLKQFRVQWFVQWLRACVCWSDHRGSHGTWSEDVCWPDFKLREVVVHGCVWGREWRRPDTGRRPGEWMLRCWSRLKPIAGETPSSGLSTSNACLRLDHPHPVGW